jgi:hypothetical protein
MKLGSLLIAARCRDRSPMAIGLVFVAGRAGM